MEYLLHVGVLNCRSQAWLCWKVGEFPAVENITAPYQRTFRKQKQNTMHTDLEEDDKPNTASGAGWTGSIRLHSVSYFPDISIEFEIWWNLVVPSV